MLVEALTDFNHFEPGHPVKHVRPGEKIEIQNDALAKGIIKQGWAKEVV